jgi:hypothetical protein
MLLSVKSTPQASTQFHVDIGEINYRSDCLTIGFYIGMTNASYFPQKLLRAPAIAQIPAWLFGAGYAHSSGELRSVMLICPRNHVLDVARWECHPDGINVRWHST